ncbi:MAG TPA: DUF58 domain-containing protein [Gemmatimonadaceae bacterium]|nr:DUF58 domain-containing protein [Gemmatimonadaceae bacterium]
MTERRLRADLVDPASLAALGRIEIIARWVVEGFLTGLHRSPRKGFSVEFAEHRAYQPGDDLRYLDWKVRARSDKWLIKQFEEETNLKATIVLDVSRSMAWSGAPGRLTKLAYAERVAAAIAWLLLRQRDAVGLIRFDDAVRTVIPPRGRSAQWRRIIGALDDPGSGKGSDAPGAIAQAARLVRRPGMVVILSDLLVDEQEMTEAVNALRAVGHDVTVIHVLDPAERDLAIARSEAELVDTETAESLLAMVSEVRDAYRETVQLALDEWRARLAASGTAYEVVLTDQPFGVGLRRAFAQRQRLP